MLADTGISSIAAVIIAAALTVAAGLALFVASRRHARGGAAAASLVVAAALVAVGVVAGPPAQAATCATPAPVVTSTPTPGASATPTPSESPTATPSESPTPTPTPTAAAVTVEFIRQCEAEPQLVVRITNTTDAEIVVGIEYRSDAGDVAGDGWPIPAQSTRDVSAWIGIALTYTVTGPDGVIAQQRVEACPPRSTAAFAQQCGTPPSYTATVTNPASVPREAIIVVTSGGTEIDRRTVSVDAESSTTAAFAITGDAEFSVSVDGAEIARQAFSACAVRDVVATITPSCTADDSEGFHLVLVNDNPVEVEVRVGVAFAGEPGVWGYTVPVGAASSAEFSRPRSTVAMSITVTQDGRHITDAVIPACAL